MITMTRKCVNFVKMEVIKLLDNNYCTIETF